MIYRLELRDRQMEFVGILDGRVSNISWAYSPVGGCAEFSFKALSKYCTELQFGGNFNVRLYRRNDTTNVYDLIYQGRIETTSPGIEFAKETIDVKGFGYQSALRDIIINQTFTSTEVSAIVKSILDNHVVPNTNITYDLADLENTGFTPDTIAFSYVTAQDAIDKLADIVGSREWGVDKNRKLFFKERMSEDGDKYKYFLGDKISSFNMNSSSREIINRVIVLGGDVAGSKFVYTKNYATNQLKYGRRDALVQNSAVKTNAVAEQLADAKQAEHNGIVDRANLTLEDEIILEETLPIKLFEVVTREINYDEKEYDTFLYAGQPAFRIRKINYKIDETGSLSSNIELGAPVPDIVENIKQLQFNLDNVIQSEA